MTPMTDRPRFRTDLVAEPIEEGGHRYIDVVDPDTGNGFRFFDVEYSLACAMDGERDLAGLVQWAKEDLGIEPSTKELATVISTLGDLGYLSTGEAAVDGEDLGLQPGVVAGPRAAFGAPAEDVELGQYERPTARMDPLPKGDFELGLAGPGGGSAAPRHEPAGGFGQGPELGASGAGNREIVMEFEAPTPPPAEMPSSKLRPMSRPDAEDDGPTNLPRPATGAEFDDDEVSVDLSDHLAISASDVKEAVRASKSMKAVEIPAELAAELDDSGAASQARLAAAREAAERAQAERMAAERAAAERAAYERAAAEAAARPPVELPRPPVGVSRPKSTSTPQPTPEPPRPVPPKEVPTARTGSMLWLVVLLLLVAAGAGGWYYWTKVLKKPLPWEKSDTTATTGTKTGTGPATGAATGSVETPPPPPPPPPPPSAQLTELAGTPQDISAGQVGIVASVAVNGSVVAMGDEIVRFKGNPAAEQKLLGLDYDIDNRVPKQIADAQKKRSEAAAAGRPTKQFEDFIAERTKRLEQKVAERDQIHASMEAMIVKAPISGTVATKINKGQRAAADQVVATVTPAPVLTATFTLPPGYAGKVPAVDSSVMVAVKATPATTANCTATAVAAPSVTVVCPTDAGIAAGTEIVLE
jgi:hypothetical protein